MSATKKSSKSAATKKAAAPNHPPWADMIKVNKKFKNVKLRTCRILLFIDGFLSYKQAFLSPRLDYNLHQEIDP